LNEICRSEYPIKITSPVLVIMPQKKCRLRNIVENGHDSLFPMLGYPCPYSLLALISHCRNLWELFTKHFVKRIHKNIVIYLITLFAFLWWDFPLGGIIGGIFFFSFYFYFSHVLFRE